MSDPHADVTLSDGIDELSKWRGDTYISTETARIIVMGLREVLEESLTDDHDAMQGSDLWANRYVANTAVMSKDARGMPTVPQYETIVNVAELSEVLAEDLGIEVGSGSAAGHARASRQRHDATVANLSDELTNA